MKPELMLLKLSAVLLGRHIADRRARRAALVAQAEKEKETFGVATVHPETELPPDMFELAGDEMLEGLGRVVSGLELRREAEGMSRFVAQVAADLLRWTDDDVEIPLAVDRAEQLVKRARAAGERLAGMKESTEARHAAELEAAQREIEFVRTEAAREIDALRAELAAVRAEVEGKA